MAWRTSAGGRPISAPMRSTSSSEGRSSASACAVYSSTARRITSSGCGRVIERSGVRASSSITAEEYTGGLDSGECLADDLLEAGLELLGHGERPGERGVERVGRGG